MTHKDEQTMTESEVRPIFWLLLLLLTVACVSERGDPRFWRYVVTPPDQTPHRLTFSLTRGEIDRGCFIDPGWHDPYFFKRHLAEVRCPAVESPLGVSIHRYCVNPEVWFHKPKPKWRGVWLKHNGYLVDCR